MAMAPPPGHGDGAIESEQAQLAAVCGGTVELVTGAAGVAGA